MSTTGGPWPADDSWTAIPPFSASILCVFITPPKERQKLHPWTAPIATGGQLAPHECALGAANCNIHECLRRIGRVGYLALLERPPIALPFRRPFVYCAAQLVG